MVIVVVGLGFVVMDAKSDIHVSGSSDAPDSTSGSSWLHSLFINTIWLSYSN